VDVAQEPRELDGGGGPNVGIDAPGTVCDWHGLRDETDASRHLQITGRRGCLETVWHLVRVVTGDAGADREVD